MSEDSEEEDFSDSDSDDPRSSHHVSKKRKSNNNDSEDEEQAYLDKIDRDAMSHHNRIKQLKSNKPLVKALTQGQHMIKRKQEARYVFKILKNAKCRSNCVTILDVIVVIVIFIS